MTGKRHRGFSFVELLASLAIMATLLLIAVPSARLTVQRHHEAELRIALAQIRSAIDDYKKATETGRVSIEIGESGYPPNLEVLVEGVVDVADPKGRKIYFLRRLPADPFHPGTSEAPEQKWGLRSYSSPPDAPEAGEDVFDVYSTSSITGLNGIQYKDW